MALAWFKTGNHTIVGSMLPTALCPLCVGLLGAYCLTVILRALYTLMYKAQTRNNRPISVSSLLPFLLLFFPFLFFLLLSFFFFPFLPFLSSFFFVSNRPWAAQNKAAHVAIAKTPQRPVRLCLYRHLFKHYLMSVCNECFFPTSDWYYHKSFSFEFELNYHFVYANINWH